MNVLQSSLSKIVGTHKVARRMCFVKAKYQSYSGSSKEVLNVGAKLEKWLRTPFDIAAFGPRASWGALLSLPERLQSLQSDVERLTELVQDPRSIEEKQVVVFRELEDTLVEFLEKGAVIETDIIANIKTVLPADIAQQLDDWIPPPPNSSSEVPPENPMEEPTIIYSQVDVMATQVASELTEIRMAVSGLKSALEGVRTNTDTSQVSIMRLNLKEARDSLARRLAEVSPATTGDAGVVAASREASILLEEVNAQFF